MQKRAPAASRRWRSRTSVTASSRSRSRPVSQRTLCGVGAVLGAGAGLDRQQGAHLHRIRRVVGAMHPLGMEHQVGERQRVQRLDFLERYPVVAHLAEPLEQRRRRDGGDRSRSPGGRGIGGRASHSWAFQAPGACDGGRPAGHVARGRFGGYCAMVGKPLQLSTRRTPKGRQSPPGDATAWRDAAVWQRWSRCAWFHPPCSVASRSTSGGWTSAAIASRCCRGAEIAPGRRYTDEGFSPNCPRRIKVSLGKHPVFRYRPSSCSGTPRRSTPLRDLKFHGDLAPARIFGALIAAAAANSGPRPTCSCPAAARQRLHERG